MTLLDENAHKTPIRRFLKDVAAAGSAARTATSTTIALAPRDVSIAACDIMSVQEDETDAAIVVLPQAVVGPCHAPFDGFSERRTVTHWSIDQETGVPLNHKEHRLKVLKLLIATKFWEHDAEHVLVIRTAKRYEKLLYQNASSLEQYLDGFTLKDRVRQLMQQEQEQQQQQQYQQQHQQQQLPPQQSPIMSSPPSISAHPLPDSCYVTPPRDSHSTATHLSLSDLNNDSILEPWRSADSSPSSSSSSSCTFLPSPSSVSGSAPHFSTPPKRRVRKSMTFAGDPGRSRRSRHLPSLQEVDNENDNSNASSLSLSIAGPAEKAHTSYFKPHSLSLTNLSTETGTRKVDEAAIHHSQAKRPMPLLAGDTNPAQISPIADHELCSQPPHRQLNAVLTHSPRTTHTPKSQAHRSLDDYDVSSNLSSSNNNDTNNTRALLAQNNNVALAHPSASHSHMPHMHLSDEKLAIVQSKYRRLLELYHAARCPNEAGSCPISAHCAEMKRLWTHLGHCRNDRCRIPHCYSSRTILQHHRKCQKKNCPVCIPVRYHIHRMEQTAVETTLATDSSTQQQRQQQQQVTIPAAPATYISSHSSLPSFRNKTTSHPAEGIVSESSTNKHFFLNQITSSLDDSVMVVDDQDDNDNSNHDNIAIHHRDLITAPIITCSSKTSAPTTQQKQQQCYYDRQQTIPEISPTLLPEISMTISTSSSSSSSSSGHAAIDGISAVSSESSSSIRCP